LLVQSPGFRGTSFCRVLPAVLNLFITSLDIISGEKNIVGYGRHAESDEAIARALQSWSKLRRKVG
jgi:hypothetical protein